MSGISNYYEDAKSAVRDAGLYYTSFDSSWQRHMDEPTKELVWNYANSLMQNDFNASQAQLAWERERQLINEQNQYNSPAAQMARYQAAGLNPNLLYGQISSGNQSSVAQYQPQKMVSPGPYVSRRDYQVKRAQEIIGMVSDILGTASNLASSFEGVKNQSLQNEILGQQIEKNEYELPLFELISSLKQNGLAGLGQDAGVSFTGNHWSITGSDTPNSDSKRSLLDILFGGQFSSSAQKQSRTDWQNAYNMDILPLLKQQLSGKSLSAEEQAKMDEYNRKMLETFPPALRPYIWLIQQLLGAVK